MKYNHVFATEADYTAATLDKPQLAYVEETEKVYCLSEDNKA